MRFLIAIHKVGLGVIFGMLLRLAMILMLSACYGPGLPGSNVNTDSDSNELIDISKNTIPEANPNYSIGLGDVLSITVYNDASRETEIELQTTVAGAGAYAFPQIGEVQLSGVSPHELQQTLTTSYAEYIKQPRVEVNVAEFNSRKAYVMGEVRQPSRIPLNLKPLSLTEAVNSESESLNLMTADFSHIYVIRDPEESEKVKIYRLNAESPDGFALGNKFMLEDEDIVFVSTSRISQWNRVISQLIPQNMVNAVDRRRFR